MRIGFLSLCVTAVLAVSVSLVGCGSDSTETPTEKVEGTPPPLACEADHDDHAGHDHGDDAGHEHPTEGPHGGHLVELGDEEYHAELTHDEATHTVAIYLLDSTGKLPVSSEQGSITVQVFKDGEFADYALKATGDDGAFSTIDEQLCDLLLHAEKVKGRLHATIAGKEYVGTIEHAAHDHDDHDDGTEHAEHDGHDH